MPLDAPPPSPSPPDALEPIRQLLRAHLAPLEAPLRAALEANRADVEQEQEVAKLAQVGPDCVSLLIGCQDLLDLLDWLMPLAGE